MFGDWMCGVIGIFEFGMMKFGVYFINIGWVVIIDQVVLIEVLLMGRIVGVVLDVFEEELFLIDYLLWLFDQLIFSLYQGYVVEQNYCIFYEGVVCNIVVWFGDGIILNEVIEIIGLFIIVMIMVQIVFVNVF